MGFRLRAWGLGFRAWGLDVPRSVQLPPPSPKPSFLVCRLLNPSGEDVGFRLGLGPKAEGMEVSSVLGGV